MTRLNDTQLVLLSAAASRGTGNLYPLPETLSERGASVTRAISALLKRDLAVVRETSDKACTYRVDGDLGYGVFLTEAGSQAINAAHVPPADQALPADDTPPSAAAAPPPPPPRVTKSASVVALLERGSGATLAELIEATGWLPHTTRAALTGLRKKGHRIERAKRDDATCYHIKAAG